MIRFPRGLRLAILTGFVLLLSTVVGSGWVFNQGGPEVPVRDPAEKGVIGLAFVDVPGGLLFLHPLPAGRVDTVFVADGDDVAAGALLLSLDSSAQRLKLREAQVVLDSAQQQFADAELLRKSHEHDLNIVGSKVEGLRATLEASTKERDGYKKLPNQYGADFVASYDAKVKAKESEVKAAEEEQKMLQEVDIEGKIRLARLNLKAKEIERDLAQVAVFECDVYAPTAGTVMRLYAGKGDVLSNQSKQPAVHFCPDLRRIARVEVLQEWASKVKEGQLAIIEDDTRYGDKWTGRVESVSHDIKPRRSMLVEPFQYNDVRTLECIVSIEHGTAPVRIGQRMKVTILQGGL